MGSPPDFDVTDQDAYDALQAKLVPLWKSIEDLNTDEQTIVVVPSAEVDFELTASRLQAYEERYLFLLLLLRQPRARMIYVTGQAIHPDIVDYYLDLMPGVISSHARQRLFLVSPQEATSRPLAQKLLDRPRLLERIRSLIIDPDRAHLVPFMASWKDRELAMRLGIPMYGADPKDSHLGTKSEGRRLFVEAGIPHPAGYEGIHSRPEVVDAIHKLRTADPNLGRVVIKHDEGVSGYGNAVVDLEGLGPPGSRQAEDELTRLLDDLKVEGPGATVDSYYQTLSEEGGIVEEMVEAAEIRSPSAQLRITPLGQVALLSTHDQILGGESHQVFIGSRFPADPDYGPAISSSALAVGQLLAAQGVIGRFAIDFVVGRDQDSEWTINAIELNLRKGGTTHPFLTLQFLTDGRFDGSTGVFTAPSGRAKYYVASDHVEAPGLSALTPHDVLDLALMRDLHFDQARQVGSVFHMLSALGAEGQIGVTSVGDSLAEAEERFEQVVAALTAEAELASGGH
ncbi:MAG: peptide ligase PGM1-related protein [Acidimicrobiia bacterium]